MVSARKNAEYSGEGGEGGPFYVVPSACMMSFQGASSGLLSKFQAVWDSCWVLWVGSPAWLQNILLGFG